jgi:hypothetical protein
MKTIDCADCASDVGAFVAAAESACLFLDHYAPGMNELAAMAAAVAEVNSRVALALEDTYREEKRASRKVAAGDH